MLAYLNTLYTDQQSFQLRADSLKKEVRQRLGIDPLLAQCVKSKPILSKIRKFDGYTVQNFALETLPRVIRLRFYLYRPNRKENMR